MPAATLISEEEFLRTSFENPEPEYRDGDGWSDRCQSLTIQMSVLSPSDPMGSASTLNGVPHIWLIDPYQRSLYVFGADGLRAVRQYEVPSHALVITPGDLFE